MNTYEQEMQQEDDDAWGLFYASTDQEHEIELFGNEVNRKNGTILNERILHGGASQQSYWDFFSPNKKDEQPRAFP